MKLDTCAAAAAVFLQVIRQAQDIIRIPCHDIAKAPANSIHHQVQIELPLSNCSITSKLSSKQMPQMRHWLVLRDLLLKAKQAPKDILRLQQEYHTTYAGLLGPKALVLPARQP